MGNQIGVTTPEGLIWDCNCQLGARDHSLGNYPECDISSLDFSVARLFFYFQSLSFGLEISLSVRIFINIFIGPESDHWEGLSLTNSLTPV